MATVEITHVAFQTFSMLSRYMLEFIGANKTLALAEKLVGVVDEKLSEAPLHGPVCHELESLGVTDYRQLTVDKYKVIYRYDELTQTVYVMAFLRHKQSVQQLLIAHSLLL